MIAIGRGWVTATATEPRESDITDMCLAWGADPSDELDRYHAAEWIAREHAEATTRTPRSR